MEHVWSSEIDSILSVGHDLKDMGVRNWALDKYAALAALDKLSAINVAVLGGDVYVVNGAAIEMNYDNWHCDRAPDEANADFVKRSLAKAKSFIADYQADSETVLFAIVPG